MTAVGTDWTTIGTKDDGLFHLYYQMKRGTQDTTNNRTYVYRRLRLVTTGSLSTNYGAVYSGTGFTTKTLSGYVAITAGTYDLLTAEGYVAHDSNGDWSQSVTGTANYGNGTFVWTASGTASLPNIPHTIPAPSSVVVEGSYDRAVAIGETIYINWTGVYGASSYDYQVTQPDGTWGGTTNVKVGNQPVTITSSYRSGLVVEARVRAHIGSNTSGWTASRNSCYVSGGMKAKVSGAWKNGNTWVKVNGSWVRAKRVWIKTGGEWKTGL